MLLAITPAVEPNLALFPLLALVAINVALFVVSQLLAPKPDIENARPKGLGDFSFPTATEGRALPLVWGKVKLVAPNVVWYGDLRTKKIREKVKTGMFSSKKVTVGHQYFVGMDFGLCYGPGVTLHEIEIADRVAWTGTASTSSANGTGVNVSAPNLFGGFKEGGGVVGTLQFYAGVSDQEKDTYLTSRLGALVPGYVDVCHAVWRQGLIGERETIDKWAFTVSRYPDNLSLPGNEHRIGDDCNPAEVLYEILTNQDWGLGEDPSKFIGAEWQAVGETLFDEGLGFAMVSDRTRRAEDLVREILRQIDAVLYQESDGRWVLRLVRGDYDPETIPQFGPDDILEVGNFTRSGWRQTQNHVSVEYTDRAKGYTTTAAMGQDLANVRIQGEQVFAQESYPGLMTGAAAHRVASRELRGRSFPLAKATLTTNRRGASLKPGDAFRFSWPAYGVTNMVMRVANVDLGELARGAVNVECFQDVFGLGTSAYAEAQPTGWTPTSNAPVAATLERVVDAPFWFMLTDQDVQGAAGERLITLAARPSGVSVDYDVYVDEGTGAGYSKVGSADHFTPTGLVETLYPETTDETDTTVGLRVKTLVDAEDIVGATAADIETYGEGLILVGNEVMAFETVTDLGGGVLRLNTVHRGLLDTVPAQHAIDTRVWFLALGNGVSEIAFGGTASINAKLRIASTSAEIDLSAATARPLTFDRRAERPLPPGLVRVEGARFPARVDADDVDVTWAHRNREDPKILDQGDASSALGLPSGHTYRIVWKVLPGGTTLRTVDFLTGTSSTYARADQTTDNAGVPPQALRMELAAKRTSDSLLSYATHVREFEVYTPSTVSVEFNSADSENLTWNSETHGFGDQWTIACWAKRTDADTLQRTIFHWLGNSRIMLYREPSTSEAFRLQCYTSGGVLFKSLLYDLGFTANAWHLFVFTHDGASSGDPTTLYFDGQVKAHNSFISTNGTGTMADDSRALLLGVEVFSNFFTGRIHSLATWNTVLSAAAAQEIFNGGRAFNLNYNKGNYAGASALRSWWKLGFQGGSTANIGKDYSLNGARDADSANNITDADIVSDAPA